MKKTCLFILGIICSSYTIGADLVVQESGPVGTYGSIAAAVSAATDGDRIIINNRPSALPWVENITINKSLTLLSAVDNQRFLVTGNYTIAHAPGRVVNIIGMENTAGHIAAGADGVTSRTIVNVTWCKLTDCTLYFNYDYFEFNLASSQMVGGSSHSVYLQYGSIIGNEMDFTDMIIYSNPTSTNDTIKIVGNKEIEYITSATTSFYVYIANNSIVETGNSLRINSSKVGPSTNVIKNNTIWANGDGIWLLSGSSGSFEIYNNVIDGTSEGIKDDSNGAVAVSYNYISSDFSAELVGVVNDGTNVTFESFSVNVASGTDTSPSSINGGNPGFSDYDLDLTRNDAGCQGGSYAWNNFHPIGGASSKVYFLEMPTEIIVGESNSVKGYSFDR